jgi:carboxypeptidase Taq
MIGKQLLRVIITEILLFPNKNLYYNQMAKEIDIDAAVEAGRFDLINGWMRDHVFNIADRMAPSEWIRAITGRSLTPDDFLDYLESKYTALYEL